MLTIAVPLFASPHIFPISDTGVHFEMDVSDTPRNVSTIDEEWKKDRTILRYQNFSAAAQRLYDTATENGDNEVIVTIDEAPESLVAHLPEKTEGVSHSIYVQKDGQYYHTNLHRFTPKPSLGAFMLRLGPLLGAIGLGTLAGYFVLTAED